MEMQIRYASRVDGAKIAYGVMGEGPPLFVPPGWVWSLEWWRAEPHRSFAERLAERFTLVVYDKHGCGLSDRERTNFTIEDDLLDMEAVVAAAGLERFPVFAWSGGAVIGAAYNGRHPERITRFAFFGVPQPFDAPVPPEERAVLDAIKALMSAHWGLGSKAFIEMFFGRDLSAEEVAQVDEAQRNAATNQLATSLLAAMPEDAEWRSYFSTVTQPALVMHRRDDRLALLGGGRALAALLPDARFVPLEGSNHIPAYGDAESVLAPVIAFLEEGAHAAPAHLQQEGVPCTILFTDIEDSTLLTQRLGDGPAQELVRGHDTVVRNELRTYDGAEIKHTGDGIMASFASPSRAIDCAIAIQRSISDRGEEAQPALRVRVGLNTGEPVVENGDLFGTAVQLARRVCDFAEPGQIVVPEGVRHLVSGKGFLFSDRGVADLKGFEDPVRVWEVRWRDE
jgi:class 3 adenylate cyclase/pimeloyl-ACP methyl ester carboxylesterase